MIRVVSHRDAGSLSKGVNQPVVNPAKMMSGVIRDKMEPKNCRTRAASRKGWRSNLYLMAKKYQNHQGYTHQQTGQHAAHEQLGHADAGRRAVNDQGMLGGKMGPMTEEAAVTAPEKSSS